MKFFNSIVLIENDILIKAEKYKKIITFNMIHVILYLFLLELIPKIKMKVYKFGGGTLKDADSIKKLPEIINIDCEIIVVISALNKTTNKFEELVEIFHNGKDYQSKLTEIKEFHLDISKNLIADKNHNLYKTIENIFKELDSFLYNNVSGDYDFVYDQIVPTGELLSTTIISSYLNNIGVENQWLDIRESIQTDNTHREAIINWSKTKKELTRNINFKNEKLYITQGYIGSNGNNISTTLGREGSDFTASIIGNVLNAEEVILWKDVDGIMNADPKCYDNAILMENVSYREAIELAFYGAKVLHPKTVKPLQNKNIPLWVKSFLNPELRGTLIFGSDTQTPSITSYIFKPDQTLVSISPKDLSFVVEKHLSKIFESLTKNRIKLNLLQNSALNFSICVDSNNTKLNNFVSELKSDFRILYNENLELITIRHYDKESIQKTIGDRKVLLQQKSRRTIQFVVGD